jgi:hypothetical protein
MSQNPTLREIAADMYREMKQDVKTIDSVPAAVRCGASWGIIFALIAVLLLFAALQRALEAIDTTRNGAGGETA